MSQRSSHRKILIIGGITTALMFGFCFAMVPLYNAFCKSTGVNTTIRADEWRNPVKRESIVSAADMRRNVAVQFIAVTNENLGWDFYPITKSVQVHPNANTKVTFYAKNNTKKDMIVQAIPSMTPGESIAHFHKIECFCFRQQPLKAGEAKEMSLVFQVDDKLPPDVHTITLAYTLFDATPKDEKKV